jgi:PEP-CTERM motif-containing protein
MRYSLPATSTFHRAIALVITATCALVLTSRSASAQTTVFSDQFNNGSTVNAAPGTPTTNSTSYETGMGNTTGASVSISSNDLDITSANTSSGFNEVAAQFTASPITLVNPGDFVDLTITFVATSNILSSAVGVNSTLAIGLYNSGGVAPLQGNSLYNNTGGSSGTGGVQNWVGYNGRMLQNGTAQLYSRNAQTGSNSRNQDLLFNNASSSLTYNSPVGSIYGTKGSVGSVLVNGDTYTMDYRLTLTAAGTIAGTNTLYSGAGIGGTELFALGATTNGTLSTTFDGLAFGYRVSAGGATQAALDLNSIVVTTNIVPEPSTVALVGAGFGLMMMAARRRRL